MPIRNSSRGAAAACLLIPALTMSAPGSAQDDALCGGTSSFSAVADVRTSVGATWGGVLVMQDRDDETLDVRAAGTTLFRSSCGDRFRIAGQARLTGWTEDQERDAHGSVDEAYAQWDIDNGRVFLMGGRRHEVNSFVLGPLSPLDVLVRTRPIDYSLTIAQRRRELEAEVMAGGEHFGDGWKLSAYYLPRTEDEITAASLGGTGMVPSFSVVDWADRERSGHRALVTASTFLPAWEVDVTALGYWSLTPTVAAGFAKTVSDSLVMYGEAAVLWGGLWPTLVADGSTGGYALKDPEEDGWRAQLTVGGTYTWAGGTTLSLEYLYNGAGLAGQDFDLLGDLADTNRSLQDTWLEALGTGRLGGLASYSGHALLRQHYLFARLAKDGIWPDGSFETTVLKPLEDTSITVSARLEQTLTPVLTLGLYAQTAVGPSRSEFGIRGNTAALTLYVRHTF